ncbi:MAG TPA: hypothetical protein V6C88_18940, partial [Chroococcidiopsis sp.]
MTPNQCLEQARQGDPEAIALLLRRNLEPKGIQVKAVKVHERALHIELESAQSPSQTALVAMLKSGLTRLNSRHIRVVRIGMGQPGNPFFDWCDE